MIERTPERLLDELVATTRARDMLADTADRLIGERDEARQQLRGAVDALRYIEETSSDPFSRVQARKALAGEWAEFMRGVAGAGGA